MYPDRSLLPREAIRLAALGFLADGAISYAALASQIRHFTSRIVGPAPELMGTSIELLRHEGLVRPVDWAAPEAEMRLVLTDAGRAELFALLRSSVRAPLNDVNRLVLALKFRFLHLLDPPDRRTQIAMMIEASEIELARLRDLAAGHAGGPEAFAGWLDQEIAAVEARLGWLGRLREPLRTGADRP